MSCASARSSARDELVEPIVRGDDSGTGDAAVALDDGSSVKRLMS